MDSNVSAYIGLIFSVSHQIDLDLGPGVQT